MNSPNPAVRKAAREKQKKARALRDQVKEIYKKKYNRTVDEMIEDEMGDVKGEKNYEAHVAKQFLDKGAVEPTLAIKYATAGAGTKEEFIKDALRGKSKAEIAQIRKDYAAKYKDSVSMDDDIRSDSSGHEGLEMDILLLGKPETPADMMKIAGMRRDFQLGDGSGLMTGTDAAKEVGANYDKMKAFHESFDWDNASEAEKAAATEKMEMMAWSVESADKVFDAEKADIADNVATGIAAVGAVAATIASAGTAGPVILAAIAAGTGAASMGAKYAIKGNSYGWEEAGVDLAMTALDAATAGLGASKALSFTDDMFKGVSNPLVQKALQGAVKQGALGAVGGFGRGMANEQAWDDGVGGALLSGLGGAAMGAASGALTGALGGGLDAKYDGPTSFIHDVVREAGEEAAGDIIALLVNPGSYKGDIGDLLSNITDTGLKAALMGAVKGGAGRVASQRAARKKSLAERVDDSTSADGSLDVDTKKQSSKNDDNDLDMDVDVDVDRDLDAGSASKQVTDDETDSGTSAKSNRDDDQNKPPLVEHSGSGAKYDPNAIDVIEGVDVSGAAPGRKKASDSDSPAPQSPKSTGDSEAEVPQRPKKSKDSDSESSDNRNKSAESSSKQRDVDETPGVKKDQHDGDAQKQLGEMYDNMALEAENAQEFGGKRKDGGFEWEYGGEVIEFSHGLVQVNYRVYLDSETHNISPADLEKLKANVIKGVDDQYNFKHTVTGPSGTDGRLHIEVEFVDSPDNAHTKVQVKPGDGPADLNNWYVDGNPTTHAHEAGHGALGLRDEYASDHPLTPPDRTSQSGDGVHHDGSLMGDYWLRNPDGTVVRDADGRPVADPNTSLKDRNLAEISERLKWREDESGVKHDPRAVDVDKVIDVDESTSFKPADTAEAAPNDPTMSPAAPAKQPPAPQTPDTERVQAVQKKLADSDGEMNTNDAYTYPGKGHRSTIDDPNSWIPERRALHDQLIKKAAADALAFADAVDGPPTIYAMRGNTGAGKSRTIKEGGLPELVDPIAATEGRPHRAVNPDNFKDDLYKADGKVPLTSDQVHAESSMLARRLQQELADMRRTDGELGSMMIDKRLGSVDDVTELADLALKTGRKLNVNDVDAPLEVSLGGSPRA